MQDSRCQGAKRQRLFSFIAMIMAAFLAYAPMKAEAAFTNPTLDTLRAALQGDAAAIATITTNLTGSTVTATTFLSTITTNLGSATAGVTLIDSIINNSDMTALSTLQNAIGGPIFGTDAIANDLVNTMAGGNGPVGLYTIQQLLRGDAGAIKVLNVLYDGHAQDLLNYILDQFGGSNCTTSGSTTTCPGYSGAMTEIANALMGDTNAFNHIISIIRNPGFGIDQVTNDWIDGIYTRSPLDPPPDPNDVPYDPPPITTPISGTYTSSTAAQSTVGQNLGASNYNPDTWTVDDNYAGPDNPCTASDAPLLDQFEVDPCQWTRDVRNLTYAQYDDQHNGQDHGHQAGWVFANYLSGLWQNQMLPALRAMTAQWYGSLVDQTRQIGEVFNSALVSKSADYLQQKQLNAGKDFQPTEQSCAAVTAVSAISDSNRLANALAKGATDDAAKRSGGGPGSTSYHGSAADVKSRWDTYCTMFLDPKVNNGINACPSPTTPGQIVDGDIDVEGFLLKDTIDMDGSEPERTAAVTILQNILQPLVTDKINDGGNNMGGDVAGVTGQQAIIRKQHVQAVYNAASSIISSIISRRAAIRNTSSGNMIHDGRIKVGIPSDRVSTNPSYNEIMLYQTKERFFGPHYYTDLARQPNELKQQQGAIKAYTVMTLQDIYQLQEQINVLLAARAAMKMDAVPQPNKIDQQGK